MRIPTLYGKVLTAGTVLALLAGCSSAGGNSFSTQVPGGSSASQPDLKTGSTFEFISDWDNDVVYVINAQGQVTTFHVNGPEGLAVDASHNLYVTDVADSDVLVYPPPYTTASKTLTDTGYRPVGVAVRQPGQRRRHERRVEQLRSG